MIRWAPRGVVRGMTNLRSLILPSLVLFAVACDASESEALHDQRAALGSSAPGVWLAVTEDEGELVRTFHGEDAPATTEVRAVPMAPDEQLSATQAQWCNYTRSGRGNRLRRTRPRRQGRDENPPGSMGRRYVVEWPAGSNSHHRQARNLTRARRMSTTHQPFGRRVPFSSVNMPARQRMPLA